MFLVAALGALLALAGGWFVQRRPHAPSAEHTVLRVVTTTPVLYSLTAKVLGSTAGLTNLVPPGASPETYALRPHDASALAAAEVLVTSGLGFEQFLGGAVADAARRGAPVITASAGIPTSGSPPDPHVWVDPLRARQMVQTIAQGLAAADPASAARYQERARDARAVLEALHEEFRAQLSAVSRKQFIAFHPAWGYFAERYEIEQVAVIAPVLGREPTAQELAELTALVERTGVRVAFSEPQFTPRIVEALAEDLGLIVYEVNPEGGELASDGYERFMRANVDVFVRALRE